MTRPLTIRAAAPDELERLAEFATDAQADPERFCAYVGDDAATIAAEVADVRDWPATTLVAVAGDRTVGWVVAEVDAEMGRVWWWGPFLAGTAAEDRAVGDELLAAGLAARADVDEHELAIDGRSALLAGLAADHGFHPEEGSALLRRELGDPDAEIVTIDPDAEIVTVDPATADDVVALHDELFPGTHTPGRLLVGNADARRARWVLRRDGELVGYVATELQHDDSLYLDFLGVVAHARNAGVGRRLVRHALRHGEAAGATHAHLTVREGNAAARALYRSIGFVEERILVPYRRGFELS